MADAAAAGAETVACNLATSEGRARVYEVAGEIDGLVNAAGIIRIIPVADITDEVWDPIFDLEREGALLPGARFWHADAGGLGDRELVIGRGKGQCVDRHALLRSVEGRRVLSVTRSLAYYLGPRGVRVNAVLPGITDTPMQERFLVEAGAIRGLTPEALR